VGGGRPRGEAVREVDADTSHTCACDTVFAHVHMFGVI